jgi:PASTA domain
MPMGMRVSLYFSRLLALAFVGLLATGTLTYGAERSATTPLKAKAGATGPKTLRVPDVRGKPYVFAEGMLEEKGFAWRVVGSVAGYAANTVVSQDPAPGVRVVDTGMPTVSLGLEANRAYAQVGVPENASPFPGTPVRLPQLVKRTTASAKAPTAAPKSKQAAATRQPAFVVPGAPPEPLSQPSLPEQARHLGAWLEKHPKGTAAERAHLSFQNWLLISGARNGWSRGAEALRILISVDRRAERKWGIGAQERLRARKALLEVRARAR